MVSGGECVSMMMGNSYFFNKSFSLFFFEIDNVHVRVSLLPRAKAFSFLLKRLIG